MIIAVYARKSRMTDKGESIENQLVLCKQYAAVHFPDATFDEYYDEGYSGSNTSRPAFQKMMQRLKKGNYNVLMCYRLDRISRNVLDFSATLDLLTKNNIAFVSIKENFDTTTPMGRAMLHISSVFAQLERETIAERIRDNMLELAKTGRWLGGTAPLGYNAKQMIYDKNGSKMKHYSILEIDLLSAHVVKLIFKKYLELGSLSQLEKYLIAQKIRSLNNKYYHSHVLKNILSNPVYCAADAQFYQYFLLLGANIVQPQLDFTGEYAPMVYNKNRQGKVCYKNNISEWIIAIGKHPPIIDSSTWLSVQKQLMINARQPLHYRHQSAHSLLSGIIYCVKCGAPMKVTNQSILKDGSISYIYRCTTKLKSYGQLCNIKNAKGHYLDAAVAEKIKEIIMSKSKIIAKLLEKKSLTSSYGLELKKEISFIKNVLLQKEKAISKLTRLIAVCEDQQIEETYQKEIKLLQEEQMTYAHQLNLLQNSDNQNNISEQDDFNHYDTDFGKYFDEASVNEKRILLRSIIQFVSWDGVKASIYFYPSKQTAESTNRNYPHGCKITDEKQ